MNFKNLFRKSLSLLIVAVMLISVASPIISAAGKLEHLHKDNVGDEKLHYVALGASNTNGFGHHGYLDPEIYEDPLAANKFQMNDYGYDKSPANAYPTLIKDALESSTGREVDLHQLAISSMRVEEVLWLLDDTFVPDDYMNWRFTGGKSWFDMAHKTGGREALRAEYRDYIANADVITVDLGWNNFGVYAFNNIMTILKEGGSRYWQDPAFDRVIDAGMEEEYYAIRDKIIERLGEFVDLSETALTDEVIQKLADVLAYAVFGACYNFDKVMEKIYDLNPDANVVVINIQNLADELILNLNGTEIPLGDLYGELIEFVDLYRATMSPHSDKYDFAYAGEEGDVDTFLDEFRLWDGDPSTLSQDMKDLFDMYDDNIYARSKIEYMMVGQVFAQIFAELRTTAAGYGLIAFANDSQYTYEFALDMAWLDGVDLAALDFNNPDTPLEEYGAAVSKHLVNLRDYEGEGKNAYNYVFDDLVYRLTNIPTLDEAIVQRDQLLASLPPEALSSYAQLIEFVTILETARTEFNKAYADLYKVYINTLNYAYDTVGTIIQYSLQFNTFYMTPDSMSNHNSKTDELLGYVINTFTNNTMLKFYEELGKVGMDNSGVVAPEITVNEELFEDPIIQAVAALEVRYDFGNSFFAHPSVKGNQQIRDAVMDALKNGSHADMFLDKKIDQYVGLVEDILNVYYEEAYAELKANGTIDDILAALDAIDDAMDVAEDEVADYQIPADLGIDAARAETVRGLLLDEFDNVRGTTDALRAIIAIESIEFSSENYDKLVDLCNNLADHLDTISALTLEIGYIADPYIAELCDLVVYYAGVISEIVEESYDYVVEKLEETNNAYLEFVELAGSYADIIDPVLGDAVRAYLIDTPRDAIMIICQYGEDAILKLIVDAAELVDDLGASIGTIIAVLGEHGEEIFGEIVADPEYAELVDAIEEKIADLMALYNDAKADPALTALDIDKIIAKEASELEELYAQLVDLVVKNVEVYDEEVADLLWAALTDIADEFGLISEAGDEYVAWLGDHTDAMLGAVLYSFLQNTLELGEAADSVIWKNINNLRDCINNYLEELAEEFCTSVEDLRSKLINYIKEYIQAQFDKIEGINPDFEFTFVIEWTEIMGEIGMFVGEALGEALNGDYVPGADSYYVAIAGSNSGYSNLVARALGLGDKYSVMSWDNIDMETLSKADFVTIGYDRTQISGFALDQFLAAVAAYGDGSLRDQIDAYLREALADDFDQAGVDEMIGNVNSAIDTALEHSAFKGKVVEDIDWSELLGEDAAYVEAALDEIADKLAEQGITGDITLSLDLVELIDEYLPEAGATIELFDNKPVFEVTVPAADLIMTAIESYLYANITLYMDYTELIIDLTEANPDVQIAVLGQYNPFVDIEIGEISIPLADTYDKIVAIANIHSFAHALALSNVTYVDIADAETNWNSLEGMEWIEAYLGNPEGEKFTDESNLYVMNQILGAYGLTCQHEYDGCTDTTCNICGSVRKELGHTYEAVVTKPDCVNGGYTTYTCTKCGDSYVDDKTNALGHAYDNACDADCNRCGEKRTPAAHQFGDWKVVLEATEEAEGREERVCSVCGYVDSRSTPRVISDEKELGTAEIISTVVGAVIIVIGVGYSFVNIIKKRKKA